jgi:hypothetical protein
MNRGDHLEVIFRDGEDPQLFLRTLAEGCTHADWQDHCFCLMSNHFHLMGAPGYLADCLRSARL